MRSWFGEISGTGGLECRGVSDGCATIRVMFSQSYVAWADANRKTLAAKQDDKWAALAGCESVWLA
ncbi:hypothetical protein CCMA1212_008989 [Trichoderma ghanense]|uniref:Uncharacterized protein n=1 Tax=Trichoderma ghanense TaxID=65468 RepID=A0ABY2GT86_9HYPO